MDKNVLQGFIKLLNSENDPDAVMGLRGVQKILKEYNINLGDILLYAADNHEQFIKEAKPAEDVQAAPQAAAPAEKAVSTNASGVPEFTVLSNGAIEVLGNSYQLSGHAVEAVDMIAVNLQDSIVAAILNKCHFKLKLFDVKNDKDEITETILRAEFDRDGMQPVQIWSNTKGEAGALAAVLRNLVKSNMPDLVA